MKFFKHVKGLTVAALALALVCTAFTATRAHAEEAAAPAVTIATKAYNPETDAIDVTVTGDYSDGKAVIYVATLKGTDKEVVKKYTTVKVPTSGAVEISLNDGKKGVKVAPNKDAYLLITETKPDGKTEVGPNLTINATKVNKIKSVTFNYTKAYPGSEDAVVTVVYTGADGNDVTLDTVEKLAGVAYYDTVNKKNSDVATADELLGDALYKMITDTEKVKGKDKAVKHKLTFTVLGNATTRSGKGKAVTVANASALKSVKVDFVKGTIAIKNGFDYAVLEAKVATGASVEIGDLTTILPKNKDAAAASTMATGSYVPQAKFDEKVKQYFTSTAVKALSLETLCGAIWEDHDAAYIYVRKSATAKKPASLFADVITVAKAAAKPTLVTSGGAIVVTKFDAKKQTITIPATSISGENTSGKTGATKGGYEYLVVDSAKLDKVDFANVKWTKYVPGKALKLTIASKFTYTGETEKSTVTPYDKEGKKLNTGVIILIRGMGIKENAKKGIDGKLPTEYVKVKFADGAKKDTFDLVLVDPVVEPEPEPAPDPTPDPNPEP